MERTASCSCGQLSIRVRGDPKIVAACSCLSCQRRTGSVFGVSSYFADQQVLEIRGEQQQFRRSADSGRSSERSFCPRCGTTVYWKAEFLADLTGIPVGAFADPGFPAPTVTVWNQSRHPWVVFPEHWPGSLTQDFGPDHDAE